MGFAGGHRHYPHRQVTTPAFAQRAPFVGSFRFGEASMRKKFFERVGASFPLGKDKFKYFIKIK
jgi:hypothetical protein